MSSQLKGKMACGGVFHIYRTRAQDVKGTGIDGQVQFQDLWECESVDADGQVVPKRDAQGELIAKVPYQEERHFHNKWTRRGLSYMMYRTLKGHSANAYNANVPEITYSNTRNPFTNFMMFSNDTINSKQGDARPEWDESDGQYVTVLSPSTGVIGEGRRGLPLSSTSGTLKRTSTLHVGQNPYGVLEYTFYAQPNSPAIETGNLGIDNFPIMAVGLSYGEECGDGEANSQIGVRAICGKPPTLAGRWERLFQHEGQQQGLDLVGKSYLLDDNIAGEVASVDGYIQDGEDTEEQLGITSVSGGAGDTIVAATRIITLAGAATMLPDTSGFDGTLHTRKLLRMVGSGTGDNNRDYTIQEVVSPTSVKVFESPTADDAGNVNAFTADLFTSYAGHNAFDGRLENYGRVEATDTGTYPVPNDTPGTIETGEIWTSPNTGVTHTIGRIFGSTVTDLVGIWVMIPNDVNINFVPNNFTIQILDPTANGGNPRPGYNDDWITVSSGAKTSQGTTIENTGVTGQQYSFDAIDARGIRLTGIQAVVSSGKVQVAELMAYKGIEDGDEPDFTGKNLRLKTAIADNYTQYELDDVVDSKDLNAYLDAINKAVRGYQMEALVSTFGQIWLRSTVAGNNSELWLDAEGAAGVATELGFPVIETQRLGITEPITKAAGDAMTIIYRVYLTGNVPGGYPE